MMKLLQARDRRVIPCFVFRDGAAATAAVRVERALWHNQGAFRPVEPVATGVRSAYRPPGPASCTRAPRSRFSMP